MVIRVSRTTSLQQPQQPSVAGGQVAPFQAIGNPAAAGAQLGRQVAGIAADIFKQERDREIQTRVNEVDIDRRSGDAEILQNFKLRLGKDAVEGRDEAMQALQANAKRVRSGIKDPAVANAWKLQDDALTLAAMDDVYGHYRTQRLQWQKDTQEARADQLVSDLGRVAFGEGYNPATGRLSAEAERTRSSLLDSVNELGDMMGWGKEQVAVAKQRADTAAIGGVAQQLMEKGRYEEASAVLVRNGDSMDPLVHAKMMASAGSANRIARIATASTNLTFDIIKQLTAPPEKVPKSDTLEPFSGVLALRQDPTRIGAAQGPAVPLSEMAFVLRGRAIIDNLYQSRQIGAEVRDATIDRLEEEAKLIRRTEAAEDKQLLDGAMQFLTERPLASVTSLPADMLEQINARGLRDNVNAFAQNRSATDPTAFVESEKLSDRYLRESSPEELANRFAGRLNKSDLETVYARRRKAIGEASKDDETALSRDERITEAFFRASGIERDETLSDKQRADKYRFRESVSKFLNAEDGPVSMDRFQEILDQVVLDQRVIDRDWAFDPVRPGSMLTEEERAEPFSLIDRATGAQSQADSNIPPLERRKIEDSLKRRGLVPTETNVQRDWWRKGGGK